MGGGGRAPCCDKSKVKRGPWSPAEDITLINFIHKNGHPNWRSLPKQAGLLRCGKSCRLRWINYLRPDVKRGNFTVEEEETIIKLHSSLGNRWSKIASQLPGRSDNEIKNVWNTKLKKTKSERKSNKTGNEIREENAEASSSSCSNGEQNTTNHDHLEQHSSLYETNKEFISSSSTSSGADEGTVGHVSDQGRVQRQEVDTCMHDHIPQEEEGVLEIPSFEECDIDFCGILDDLEKDGLPLVDQLPQSTNDAQEFGGGDDDYTKWFEYELELEEGATATATAADHQAVGFIFANHQTYPCLP